MRVVLIAGPPCAGKTTLVRHLAVPDDVVLDYDVIAHGIGSPVRWLHPEPYRTVAEQELQARLACAHDEPSTGTCWLIRMAPLLRTRKAVAEQWGAVVYVLSPGEQECRRRARAQHRPSGTGQRIGHWYNHYRPWQDDLDAGLLDGWPLTDHEATSNE